MSERIAFEIIPPISGNVSSANVEFGFEMKVTRVNEAPRITKPFSDDSWRRLDALGEKVDGDLAAGFLHRLGTFVERGRDVLRHELGQGLRELCANPLRFEHDEAVVTEESEQDARERIGEALPVSR